MSATNIAVIDATSFGGSTDVTLNQNILQAGRATGDAVNAADITAKSFGGSTTVDVNQNIAQFKMPLWHPLPPFHCPVYYPLPE